MILMISPAKTFRKSQKVYNQYPVFKKSTDILLKHLKSLSIDQLKDCMKLSLNVAQKTYAYYQAFDKELQPAIFTYFGHQYKLIDAISLASKDLNYLNNHVYIMSGLYGLLKPLDMISFYRLEMKDRSFKNLYDFWKPKITNHLKSNHLHEIIINLASLEYGQLVKNLDFVYTLEFYLIKDDKLSIHSMEAKKLRGLITRHIITQKIDSLDALKKITIEGYSYNSNLSKNKTLLFTKKDINYEKIIKTTT